MALTQYSNNAQTTLASAITAAATQLSVVSGGGSLFPALTGSQYFRATLVKSGNATVYEIVKVIGSPSSDTFTIVRAQEGTTALAWNAGDYFNLLLTAGDMGDAVQKDDLQAQAPNFGRDTGTANAYSVVYTPAIAAHVIGAPLRWIAANTNTGASTFNDGAGAAPLVLPGGAALVAGQIVAGGMYTAIYDGTNFQIPEIPTNLNTLYQQIINAVYPIGGYAFWENDSLNPNTVFTFQTWVEVTGYVLVGRQTSTSQFATTGQTGGELTHQLVVSEVPPLPFQDAYYAEGSSSSGGPTNGNPQPGDLWMNLGGLNHSVGSGSTDYDNAGSYYRNANTQSGVAGGVASGHNNLQPYRVVRMWRRTA